MSKSTREQNKCTFSFITMTLNTTGSGPADAPSIYAFIDLEHDTSFCKRAPSQEKLPSIYSLSDEDISKISSLVNGIDPKKMKKTYNAKRAPFPLSTMILQQGKKAYKVTDHGLGGDNLLQELYKIVYKTAV